VFPCGPEFNLLGFLLSSPRESWSSRTGCHSDGVTVKPAAEAPICLKTQMFYGPICMFPTNS
jgi:hypothetical protein